MARTTLRDLFERGLRHELAAGARQSARARRCKIRWVTAEGGLPPGLDVADRAAMSIQGPRVFDVQIALTAFDHGATEIWTHDRNFASLPGLRVHDPL